MIYVIRALCAAALLSFSMGAAAGQSNTIITLYSFNNPSAYGSPVTFDAVLYSTTGTVQFMDGANNLGDPVPVTANVGFGPTAYDAALQTSALSPGSHVISAVFSGDALNGPATATLTQVVNAPVLPVSVPALSAWQEALFALLVGVIGVALIRRI